MTRAVTRLDEAPTSLLLGPVGPARLDAQAQLDELGRSVHATHLLLQGLPRFLGGEGRQRYFFGAQDPAELRGTGGLIGAYSILTTDDGRFHFTPFLPIHGLTPPPVESVPSPNPDFRANYDQFRVDGRFWTSINVMPDMPTVGQAILSSYEAVTGERLDGVILADPFAEAALLRATGPVRIPGYDIEIGADNVVPFTTNEAFAVFTDPAMRKVLGDVARVVFEQFVSQEAADHLDLEQFVDAAADRHILMFSTDASMQEGLQATPVGGALLPPGSDGDLLSVVVNSAAGSKVDFYQDPNFRYAIDLQNDGFGVADLDVTLRNDAPKSGQPGYVIGPAGSEKGTVLEHLRAGESVALVNAYCGTDCVPVERREGDGPLRTVGSKTDLGVRYEQRYVPIRSGQDHTFESPGPTERLGGQQFRGRLPHDVRESGHGPAHDAPSADRASGGDADRLRECSAPCRPGRGSVRGRARVAPGSHGRVRAAAPRQAVARRDPVPLRPDFQTDGPQIRSASLSRNALERSALAARSPTLRRPPMPGPLDRASQTVRQRDRRRPAEHRARSRDVRATDLGSSRGAP